MKDFFLAYSLSVFLVVLLLSLLTTPVVAATVGGALLIAGGPLSLLLNNFPRFLILLAKVGNFITRFFGFSPILSEAESDILVESEEKPKITPYPTLRTQATPISPTTSSAHRDSFSFKDSFSSAYSEEDQQTLSSLFSAKSFTSSFFSVCNENNNENNSGEEVEKTPVTPKK